MLASGRNVNILVLDTEVYSNTGGQASKSTPRAAVAKFAMGGKGLPKKDLGLIAMSYGYVYVARVAMGANDQQTLRALLEAESYDGPSLIIAYSPLHRARLRSGQGSRTAKLAVQSGHWPMYRYDPRLAEQGQNPLIIESKEPSIPISQYAYNETRYKMLTQMDEERAEKLMRKHNTTPSPAGRSISRWLPCTTETAKMAKRRKIMTDLSTTYLGLNLKNPLVASASPLSKKLGEGTQTGGCRHRSNRDVFALRGADHPRKP